MKKFLSVLLAFCIVIGSTTIVVANSDITVILDGKTLQFDQPPIIVNGRTLVPMRAIFEALGATVEWNETSQYAYGQMNGIAVFYFIDNQTMYKNTVPMTLDVPATLINGRTYIPLRAVSEDFDAIVDWNEGAQTIYITSTDVFGYLYDSNGNIIYAGEIANGLANGFGSAYSEDGMIKYAGEFVNDKASGQGSLYQSGKLLYSGSFVDDKINGTGYRTADNGNYVYGTYIDGLLSNNYGTERDQHGNVVYIGQFDANLKYSGFGTMYNTSTSQETYNGYFLDGVYNGKGDVYDDYGNYLYTDTFYNGKTSSEAYQEEISNLNEWRSQQLEKLYHLENDDPCKTDWGKSILAQYGITSTTDDSSNSGSGDNAGNIDSFAAANALRQRQAVLNNAMTAVYAEQQAKIKELSDLIETYYNTQLQLIKQKYGMQYQ